MDTLEVLARLERQALDEERLRLQAIDHQLGELGDQLADLRHAVVAERQVAAQLAPQLLDTQAALAAYLGANRARQRATAARIAELEAARGEQMGRVLARRLELERLELLAERRRQRRLDAGRRQAQQAIDEQALIRAARSRHGS